MPKKQTILPVTLDRHLVFIFPTRQGLFFIIAMIAMLAGSINYNNNLGFLLVFLLGGIFLVSMIHTYRNLLGLKVLAFSAKPVFAGDDAVFDVFLCPDGHARKALVVSAKRGKDDTITDLSANVNAKARVFVPTRYRGILRPESYTISTVYPLGLFCAWSVLRPETECTVYPAPISGPIVSTGYGIEKGDRQQGRVTGIDDFKGLKSYQPGDSFRHIAWKSLSRGQGVLTKDFDGDQGLTHIFDFSELKSDDTEMRLSRLSGMVLQASRETLKYGLVLPGKTILPDSGAFHKHKCLKSLALF